MGSKWTTTIVIAAAVLAAGCSGHSSPPTPATPNPLPALASVSPAGAIAGAAAFTLTVTGSGFVSSSSVNWNGSPRTTTYASPTQLMAAVTAADIAASGSASVTVVSPAPGGGTSGAIAFAITAPNPAPNLTSVTPTSATAGAAAFALTVTGTGFISSSTVNWNGSARITTYSGSSTQLTAAITAADIATIGSASITVVNPAPGGGTSGAIAFPIAAPNPAPTLTSLLPAAATAGTAAFSLTVNGSGFTSSSIVNWNGSARITTYSGSSTQLMAAITAADIAMAASVPVTVVNPAPGGGISPAISFIISPAVAAAGFVTVVSQSITGVYGNSYSRFPSIGADGRFVSFQSGATNLVSTPIQDEQIFLRDTCMGASSCTPSTTLISVDGAGTASANASSDTAMASVSTDGNSVVFASPASNMNALAYPPEQTFLRTTCTAQSSCTPNTQFTILETTEVPPEYGSFAAAIETTGRFILSAAISGELVGSQFMPIGVFDPNVVELYETDTCQTSAGPIANCTAQNIGITVTAGNEFSESATSVDYLYGFSVSKGGRFVAFGSAATDLLATPVALPAGIEQIYLHDTCSALNNPVAGCAQQTVLISQSNTGAAGTFASVGPSVSDDGRFVAFQSASALAPLASGGNTNVFLRDTCLAFTAAPVAGCTPTTYLISTNAAGTGDGGGSFSSSVSQSPSLSADGRLVAFFSFSNALTNPASQGGGMYLRDTCNSSSGPIAGCTPHTVALSFDGSGNFLYAQGTFALSSDGHYLAFAVSGGFGGMFPNQVVLVSTGY